MNHETIFKFLFLLMIASPFVYMVGKYLYISFVSDPRHFKESFQKFNENRINPLSEDGFRKIYDYQWNLGVALLTRGEVGGGNQRDGDELMENSTRNPVTRINDHMDFDRNKRGSLVVGGLGYNFKKKDNFIGFVTMFLKEMNEGTIVVPVNGTWAVFQKDEKGNIGYSIDKSILTNKDYRYREIS